MSKSKTVIGLGGALTALVGPATLVPAIADAHTTDVGSQEAQQPAVKPTVAVPFGSQLMAFTVSDSADGVAVAQHESHASHASHESHASHASHSSHQSMML
jgi:hypothetical protein